MHSVSLQVDAIADASVSMGIPRSTALKIAIESLRSANRVLTERMTAEELRTALLTPKDITQVEKGDIRSATAETVKEATQIAEAM